MDTRLLILIVIISMLISACASEENTDDTNQEITQPSTEVLPPPNPFQPKDTGVYLSEGVFDGFLLGKWTFDISVDVLDEEADKTKRGNVVELKNDFTYQIMSKGKVIEKGKFEYNRTREFLVIRPSGADPSEWKVSMMGNSLVWASTERFKNRGTQIRLYQGEVDLEDQ